MPTSSKHRADPARQQPSAKPAAKSAIRRPLDQPSQRQAQRLGAASAARKRRILRFGIWTLIGLGALGGLYAAFNSGSKSSDPHGGSGPTYVVGSPGPGAPAPPVSLPTTSGGTFDLAAYRGQRVLLYFQEGVTCQPCWTQLQGIDANLAAFRALGITEVASIAIDPASALRTMAASNNITTPVLADSTGVVSDAYHANDYGMMGTSEDGHSFVLVGRTGKILWRADFGGPPNYTMYVPVTSLLSDLRAGVAHARP
jgi:peroxiredoxin Q/BCP